MKSGRLPSRGGRDSLVALAIIGAHLCLAAPLAVWLNIWIDESYSLSTSAHGVLEAFRRAHSIEQQPPLYFVVLAAWRGLNASIPFARLLSVVAVALGLWVSHLAARRWFKGVSSFWLLVPLAFNTSTLYASTEIRAYGLVFLWVAALLALFYDGFCDVRPSRRAQGLYAVVAVLALYTFYFCGYFLVAGAAVLLVQRRWRRLAEYCALMVAVGLLFLPELSNATSSVEDALPMPAGMPSVFKSLGFAGARMVALPFGLTYLPNGVRLPVSILAVLAMVLIVWVQRSRISASTVALWVLFAAISICYGVVVWRMMGTTLAARHLIVGLLPATFAGFSVAAQVFDGRRVALVCWLVPALGFTAAATAVSFGHLAKGGDFRRVAQYLQANEQAGQPVIIVPAYEEAPLDHYYGGINQIVPLPARDDFERYDRSRWQFESEDQAAALLKETIPGESAFWIFTDYPLDDLEDSTWSGLNLNFFENVLVRDYEQVSERDFYVAKVRQFRRK